MRSINDADMSASHQFKSLATFGKASEVVPNRRSALPDYFFAGLLPFGLILCSSDFWWPTFFSRPFVCWLVVPASAALRPRDLLNPGLSFALYLFFVAID